MFKVFPRQEGGGGNSVSFCLTDSRLIQGYSLFATGFLMHFRKSVLLENETNVGALSEWPSWDWWGHPHPSPADPVQDFLSSLRLIVHSWHDKGGREHRKTHLTAADFWNQTSALACSLAVSVSPTPNLHSCFYMQDHSSEFSVGTKATGGQIYWFSFHLSTTQFLQSITFLQQEPPGQNIDMKLNSGWDCY